MFAGSATSEAQVVAAARALITVATSARAPITPTDLAGTFNSVSTGTSGSVCIARMSRSAALRRPQPVYHVYSQVPMCGSGWRSTSPTSTLLL
jgi:hypothetical protein